MAKKIKIKFKCTKCGECCRTSDSIGKMNLKHWGLSTKEGSGECINLKEDGRCGIYKTRPLPCRMEEIYDRVEEIKDIEPWLYKEVKKFKNKSDFFCALHGNCNLLIARNRNLDFDKFKIDVAEEFQKNATREAKKGKYIPTKYEQ